MLKVSSKAWRMEILTILLMTFSELKGISESYFVKPQYTDYKYGSEYLLWKIILHSTESCVVHCHTTSRCVSILFDSNKKECYGFRTLLQYHATETGTVNDAEYFQIKGPSETTIWDISLWTGTQLEAGTDNDVYVSILGTKASILDRDLDNPGNDREEGDRDDYQIVGENIGIPIKIKISYAPDDSNTDRWFLHKVELSAMISYTVIVDKWFDVNTTQILDLKQVN